MNCPLAISEAGPDASRRFDSWVRLVPHDDEDSNVGVSLNLRAIERDIKDVADTSKTLSLKTYRQSRTSGPWNIRCLVRLSIIESLTRRLSYRDIGHAMTGGILFRSRNVPHSDAPDYRRYGKCPPIPERFSGLAQRPGRRSRTRVQR